MSASEQIRRPPRSLVGPIPDPDELYGRNDFIDHLWRLIDANNILLLAPRRFGKSGVMRHVLLHPRPGYVPMSFELEDVDSPEEFVWRITKELLARDKFRRILSQTKRLPAGVMTWVRKNFDEAEFEGAKVKFKAEIRADWRDAARRMLVELEQAEETAIFLFDELPAMLDLILERQGVEVANDFLAWFRTVRMAQRDVLRRHRFIVAGSVGIDQILRKLNATDKLVDFARLTVDPLDASPAKQLVEDLAGTFEITWTQELSERLFALIGAPVPYFIHVFFAQLGQLTAAARTSMSIAELNRVYTEAVLGPTCRHYFSHYSSRLKRYGSQGEKASMAILRAVSGHGRVSRPVLFDVYRKGRGRGATELEFDDLLASLEYDWYLRLDPDTNEYYFRLKVMEEWWRRWYPLSARAAKARKR